jgi:hypothetical protein
MALALVLLVSGALLQPLRVLQKAQGARLAPIAYGDGLITAEPIPVCFAQDEALLTPLLKAVADDCLVLCRSHWRVIRLRGQDRYRFAHSQLTNEFVDVPAGSVRDACVLDSQGRTVDLTTVADVTQTSELCILASPNRGDRLAAAFDKVIFPLDKVEVTLDPEGVSALFEVLGPRASARAAAALGVTEAELPDDGRCALVGEVLVIGGGSFSRVHGRACTLLAPAASATELWSRLSDGGVALGGDAEYHALRIACGRPFPDAELTRNINPLEAGLYHTISFAKGCYLGQETVSKVNAAPAPKQRLMGLRFERAVAPGTTLVVDDDSATRAGVVTSMLACGRGLGTIRSAIGAAGLRVRTVPDDDGGAAPTRGEVTEIAYASRSEGQSVRAIEQVTVAVGAEELRATAAAAAAAETEAARKAAKLAAMAERFAAFKAAEAAKAANMKATALPQMPQ